MRESSKVFGRLPLHAFAEIDPETLSPSTPSGFSFKYIEISAVSQGKLTIPRTSTAFSEAPSRARRVLRAGDVIMSTVRPNLKAFAYCDLDEERYVASTGFAVLRAKESADPYFLLCAVLSNDVTKQIDSFAVGSNYPAINSSDVRRLLIPAHTLPEQKRIAEILSCIDTAIEKTEALIAKHQQIKAGLMHDLFTRGVLPNGQLRPPRSEAPELYQETALGWIPRDWSVSALNDKVNPARPIVYGILMPGYGHPGGVPVVKVKDIRDRSIDVANLLLTSPAIDQEYRRSRLKGGDVLFTIRGTVGRVSLVPAVLENANITQDTARIDLLDVSNTFISLFLESSAAKRFFEINTLGVAVQGINLGELRKLPIPVPSQDEQEEISARLFCCLEYIDNEVAKKHKLEAQKLGLMQDLLTGRVPVPAEAAEAAT